jgi:hypothetical protein
MEPIAEQLVLPEGYGRPRKLLRWANVRQRLEQAEQYWLATTRPDGRPHVVPVDGVWFDGVWYFGGAAEAVHQRNLRHDPRIVMHLAEPVSAIIVEGVAKWRKPGDREARGIADATNLKYAAYGYAVRPENYAPGVWGLRPNVVLAWDRLDLDATRFTFRDEG